MAKNMTKSAFIEAVTSKLGDGVSKKQVATVLETMIDVGHKEFKQRPGINPFTKEPITIAAKPASKKVRARPVKAIKDVVA
jgi:DNA-binding protein HU-beta